MYKLDFISEPTVTLIQSSGSDDMVAMAAWVSNALDDEERLLDKTKVKGLINFLYRNKHMSPFEHGQFTWKIECPLFVAREFHRHRTFSYNEWSGRYSELLPKFYVPAEDRPIVQSGKIGSYKFVPGSPMQINAVRALHEYAYQTSWDSYQEMLEFGIAKEVARNVLPLGTYTKFYATVNPRNLMHFLDLRTDQQALFEIRQVANQMEIEFKVAMPFTFDAWKENYE